MPVSFNNLFGIHEQALNLRAKRAEVLANNIANSNTPGFKAKDINFEKELSAAMRSESTKGSQVERQAQLLYRKSYQSDHGDGNTVDMQFEKTKYAENALQYQTTLTYLNGRIKSTLMAIRGD